MSAEILRVEVRKSWRDFRLDVNESIPLRGTTALFGPSGSGKTALLRCMAGLDSPDQGRIEVGHETWFDSQGGRNLPPHRRAVGMLFQDVRLFSHLDVRGNLDFANRRNRRPGPIHDDVVESLGLGDLMQRRVETLSGGEKQRVALGRTLLRRPRLLLLDEPLAALDTERKRDILPYLDSIPRDFGVPAIYVSHSIDEVARLAERVLVIADGHAHAQGATEEILARLDLQPLLGRFEAGVLLDATVQAHDPRLRMTQLSVGEHRISMPMVERLEPNSRVRLRVRARDVSLAAQQPEEISIQNVLPGRIARIEAESGSAFVEVFVDLGGPQLRSRITYAAMTQLDLKLEQPIFALLKSVSLDRRLV